MHHSIVVPAGFAILLALVFHSGAAAVRAQAQPRAISDAEFWRLTMELSEPGGAFARQLMSNEDSLAFVVPSLSKRVRTGGTYIGVGAEQNFTYLAALRPSVAFIVDIRRDNMLELLLYKALFEIAADRADFISRLFSRNRPGRLGATSTVTALFDAYAAEAPDAALFERTARAVLDALIQTHGFVLSEADQTAITSMLDTFGRLGPDGLKGFGDRTNPTYAQLMAAPDLQGHPVGFLASEDEYRVVRDLERRNVIVGIVGDFAGDRALAGIARYLAARHATVDVFYVSNVERYLFEQGEHGRQFSRNVALLPVNDSSLFIRSVTRDISERLGIAIPQRPTKWWTFLFSIREYLAGIADGRMQTYRDLFAAPVDTGGTRN